MDANKLMLAAEIQVLGNQIAESVGAPFGGAVQIIDCDDPLPSICSNKCHRLRTFRLEGYSPTFFVIGGQDIDHYFVVILMGTQGYQAAPSNVEDSYQFRTQELAEAEFNDGIVIPFIFNLINRITPAKMDAYLAMCDAMNGRGPDAQ